MDRLFLRSVPWAASTNPVMESCDISNSGNEGSSGSSIIHSRFLLGKLGSKVRLWKTMPQSFVLRRCFTTCFINQKWWSAGALENLLRDMMACPMWGLHAMHAHIISPSKVLHSKPCFCTNSECSADPSDGPMALNISRTESEGNGEMLRDGAVNFDGSVSHPCDCSILSMCFSQWISMQSECWLTFTPLKSSIKPKYLKGASFSYGGFNFNPITSQTRLATSSDGAAKAKSSTWPRMKKGVPLTSPLHVDLSCLALWILNSVDSKIFDVWFSQSFPDSGWPCNPNSFPHRPQQLS